MPAYEFICGDCGNTDEQVYPMDPGPPQEIDCKCGGVMTRLYSCQFILKGGDWAGVAVKHGDDYRDRWKQREKDEESMHNMGVAQSECDEIMKHRRMGRKASKEHRKHHGKMWDRYTKNKRKGIVKE